MWRAAPAQHFELGGPSGRAGREGASRLDHDDAHDGGIETRRGSAAVVTPRARLHERERERATGSTTASNRAEQTTVLDRHIARGGMAHRVVVGSLHARADP